MAGGLIYAMVVRMKNKRYWYLVANTGDRTGFHVIISDSEFQIDEAYLAIGGEVIIHSWREISEREYNGLQFLIKE